MKKFLTLLLLPVLAFTSCHSDDSIIVPKATAKLIVEASSLEGFVNKPVYFTVKDDKGNDVPVEATVINVTSKNGIVKDRKFTPKAAGEYKIIAQTAIPGRIYETSDAITIKITEPTKKELSIDGKVFAAEKATLSVVKAKEKNQAGEEVLRDKLVKLGDIYYNEYSLNVHDLKGDFLENSITVVFLIPNKSVKHANGVITDYGKRVYPNDLTKTTLRQVISYQKIGGYVITNVYATKESDNLEFYNVEKPKDGLESQVLPKSYFEFNYPKLGINYIGDLKLDEVIEQ